MSDSIRCTCGNRVREEDLLEAGLYLADSGTGSVYVKFICSRCERVAQRTLSLDEWDEGRILFSDQDEAGDQGDRREAGLITHAEIRAFEADLEDGDQAMETLRGSARFPNRRARRGHDPGHS
ncbi:MAG: hypothetical protein GF320_09585 [Armatimonadia bacterium]|nr:hypothetical protein [Armatimonadia bacterium]